MVETWAPDFILFIGSFMITVYLATVFYDVIFWKLELSDDELDQELMKDKTIF